ncbi:hypothetical protein CHUAL_006207 [Chamberlinius hualienensis]
MINMFMKTMGDRATTKHRIQPTSRGSTSGVPKVGDEMTCVFCDVSIGASSCIMTSCGHPVCPLCLDELNNGASKCPIDGTIVNRNNVRKVSEQPKSPTTPAILFRCPNKDKCDQLLPMELLQEHLVKCLQSKSPQPASIVHAVGHQANKPSPELTPPQPVIMRPHSTSNTKRRPLSMSSGDLAMASMSEQRQQIEFLRDSIMTVEMRVDKLLHVVRDGLSNLQESSNDTKKQTNVRIEELDKQLKELTDQMKQLKVAIDHKNESAAAVVVAAAAEQEVCYDGVLVWKVEGYSRLKQIQTDICSPPFYSSHFGYKMCLSLDVMGDGSGRGSHVSIYLCLMKGKYDDVLNWPFQQKITFMLLDQRETRDKTHLIRTLIPDFNWPEFNRPVNDRSVGRGFHRFVSHEIIESLDYCYVKNDCIYIKAIVDDTIIL